MDTNTHAVELMKTYGDYFFVVTGFVGNPLVSLQSRAAMEESIETDLAKAQEVVRTAENALVALRRNKLQSANDPETPVAFFDADDLDEDRAEREWNERNW